MVSTMTQWDLPFWKCMHRGTSSPLWLVNSPKMFRKNLNPLVSHRSFAKVQRPCLIFTQWTDLMFSFKQFSKIYLSSVSNFVLSGSNVHGWLHSSLIVTWVVEYYTLFLQQRRQDYANMFIEVKILGRNFEKYFIDSWK